MTRVNLIPMAGEGQRFIDCGYSTPKPLIDIKGLPMVVRAAKCLPEADKWIFVCREKHIVEKNIKNVLLKFFPNSIVLSINKLTDGQARTCLLAKDYIENDDELTIGACDNSMIYNKTKYNKLIKEKDALIWTFRNNPAVIKNPEMYGWVKSSYQNEAKGVSCKIPISNDPINDHAIVGAFSFRKAKYFFKYADKIISKKRKINNEYYLDIVLDELIIDQYNVHAFEIKDYICWGTPTDLEKYMESCNE